MKVTRALIQESKLTIEYKVDIANLHSFFNDCVSVSTFQEVSAVNDVLESRKANLTE